MATVRKIFDMAAAILFENYGGDADFVQYSPLFLERLLQEALPYENAVRQYEGRPQLAHVPDIATIDETELDWDDDICKNALVHGLASALMADDNQKRAEAVMEYNKFVQALNDTSPAIAGYDYEDN